MMAKSDHPSYGGKTTPDQPKYQPHLLPSMFEDGVYFLHQEVRGEHSVTTVRGEAQAQEMLSVATRRTRSH